jgi:hypothetical protein
MKNLIFIIALLIFTPTEFTAQDISPYLTVGERSDGLEQTSEMIINALEENSFTILGAYNPSGKSSLKVIAFTRNDLKNTVVKVKDRGALAAILKIGLVKNNDKVLVSYTNPDYLLRAYLREHYYAYQETLEKVGDDLRSALSAIGNDFTPFGGTVEEDKLKKYHYKIMMPYFTDPVELNEFSSFEEGLSIIENNLKAGKGNTSMVYKLIYSSKEIAVFGVGLNSKEDGEAHFLPKIGEAHAAALPYEIILQGNVATMLHGKYRIALHWPDLTMGTFMKIMSTPGDIEETMEGLCQ